MLPGVLLAKIFYLGSFFQDPQFPQFLGKWEQRQERELLGFFIFLYESLLHACWKSINLDCSFFPFAGRLAFPTPRRFSWVIPPFNAESRKSFANFSGCNITAMFSVRKTRITFTFFAFATYNENASALPFLFFPYCRYLYPSLALGTDVVPHDKDWVHDQYRWRQGEGNCLQWSKLIQNPQIDYIFCFTKGFLQATCFHSVSQSSPPYFLYSLITRIHRFKVPSRIPSNYIFQFVFSKILSDKYDCCKFQVYLVCGTLKSWICPTYDVFAI